MKKGRGAGLLLLLCVGVLVLTSFASAEARSAPSEQQTWQLAPVFEQNPVDGLLLGARGGVTLWGFKPSVALGYGLESGRLRYSVGFGRGGLSLALKDWPGSPLLGREGESGLALALDWKGSGVELSLAAVRPWAREGEGESEKAPPQVSYLHMESAHTLEGPYGLKLDLEGTFTIGVAESESEGEGENRSLLQAQTHRLSVRWGDLRFRGAWGEASPQATLPGFEFTQHLRGYEDPLKGRIFWRAELERRVLLLRLPLGLPPLPFAEWLPEALWVEAAAFVRGLSVTPTLDCDPDCETEVIAKPQNLFGWGVGVVFSLGEFEFRADVFFARDGKVRHLLG